MATRMQKQYRALKVQGNVELTISATDDGVKLSGSVPFCWECRDDELVIKPKDGGGGGTVIMSNGRVSISNCSNNYNSFNFSGTHQRFIVNGVDVTDTINNAQNQPTKKQPEEDDKFKREHIIPGTATFSSVSLQGNGDIHFEGDTTLDRDELHLTLQGNGDIALARCGTVGSLTVVLMGNGDVDGGGVQCDTLAIQLMGMGNIQKFHAIRSASLVAVGMGNIHISAATTCRVTKSRTGLGDIKVSIKK